MWCVAFTLRLSEELLAEVEGLRGDVPRSVWVRRALEMRVEAEREARSERPGPVASADTREALSFPTPHDEPDPRMLARRASNTLVDEGAQWGGAAHLPTCRCGVCKP